MADVRCLVGLTNTASLAKCFLWTGRNPDAETMDFCSRYRVIRIGKVENEFGKKNKNNVDTLSWIQVKTTSSS